MLDDFGGVASNYNVIGHILRHHGTRRHGNVVADSDAGVDDAAAAQPAIVSDADGPTVLCSLDALLRLHGVRGGVDLNRGPQHAVVADRHVAYVKDDAVEVGVEALAHLQYS